MKYAIKKLDDSEFRNAFSRSYIRVKEYDSKRESSRSPRGRSYSRSPSRSRSRSRSVSKSPKTKSTRRSPARSRSPSRSRSKSPSLSGSRSRSRSPLPSREKQLSKSPKKRSASRSPSRSRSRSRSKSLSRYILNWLIHSQVNADALRTSVDPSKVPPCRCQSTKTYSFSLALFRICQSLPHKSQFAEFGDPEYPCGPTELEVADDTLHDAPGINMLRTRIANKMARDHNMPEIS